MHLPLSQWAQDRTMTTREPLPEAFQRPYLDADAYPKNLIHRTLQTSPSALAKISDRLNEAAGGLFEREDGILDVPFRDLRLATGEGEITCGTLFSCNLLILYHTDLVLDKENIGSALDLEQWLKIDVSSDRTNTLAPTVVSSSAGDPKCRLM